MKKYFSILLPLVPSVAMAQSTVTDVNTVGSKLLGIGNTITYLLVALLVITIPVGIILGIVLAVKASNEQDKSKKRRTIWWMVISFIAPIVLLFLVLSGWGLINILSNTFQN